MPYKGTGPALADVISGIITMNFSSLPPAVGQVKAGNLRALAVTGEKRIKSLPDVPTLKEQGIDVVVNGWHGLFAPAKTHDTILDKIEKDTKQAMKDPKWEEALAKDGLELPPDRTAVIHSDSAYALGLLGKGWKAKANQELVERMRMLAKKFKDLRLVKVAGHAGIAENERADLLARTAITKRG